MSNWILVVDDESDIEPLFRQRFRKELREGAFAMEFATSGPQALDRLAHAAQPGRLILVLSDVNMPEMSGLELVSRIKGRLPNVPVIMITAYGDSDTRSLALARGAQELLTKPIDFGLLKGEIAQRIGATG